MLFEELTVDNFLDSIEEEQIYQMICSIDQELVQVLLMHLQGYSLHDIGQKVGISGSAVKKLLQRLKKKFFKMILVSDP
ncbi:sigma factor-like helix-turn-helix DNA-binding protein [Butyricicoccus sp.]|uniref:sigma factor-like helix-turn-helix DNA-binding protein n=1 Tax=Butyricicoccus sp. TaxID=2049021 RepID=UPI003F18F1DD